MTVPLFLDPSVLLLAVGAADPRRQACREVLTAAAEGRAQLHLSVGGGQEFLFHRLRRSDGASAVAAFDLVDALVVWHPFTVEVLRRSRGLLAQGGVPGRDAAHAATALEGGFGAIVSCDADFRRPGRPAEDRPDVGAPCLDGSMTDIAVTGIAHSKFGKLADETVESLVVGVVREALADAGVEPGQVDEVFLGQFNAGLVPLAFPSSLVMQADDALFGVPMTHVENACASGSAAVHQGIKSLRAGCARTVLVVGAEKMTHAGADQVGAALLGADYELAGTESTTGFAGLFARVAEAYAAAYGDVEETLAMIASKNHANGMKNPYAQLHKEFSVEFCATESEKNPRVAGPLKRTDCSPVSDGAAALVLQADPAGGLARVTGFGQANDFLPAEKKDPTAFAGSELAIRRALDMAGVGLDDLSLAEVHDCFTIAELVIYEAMGLTPRGEGRRALDEGWVFPGGRLPVNVSGGLKSKGHPVGATGVSQHVLAAMQLSGRAGDMQVADASRALVHNMGGLAVANYATVLEAYA